MFFNFYIPTVLLVTIVMLTGATMAEEQEANNTVINLTDGYGLLAKPTPATSEQRKQQYQQGIESCESNYVTPFGKVLGEANGVGGYSNCRSICIKPEFSFMSLSDKSVSLHTKNPKQDNQHYVGLINQCVEYARRWWMTNLGITFGDIDSAYEIIYLTQGKNIYNGFKFDLVRSINGSARRPPQRGDLLIYYPDRENPLWRHGHVAVVVAVNLDTGTVSVAEQNYSNQAWAEPLEYSRKIQIFTVGGRYRIVDTDVSSHINPGGGLISGWIYPAASI